MASEENVNNIYGLRDITTSLEYTIATFNFIWDEMGLTEELRSQRFKTIDM